MNDETITIGERHGWGDPQRFGIPAEDQRHHITLGHSVGLIDPHDDLAEELLHHNPPHRADHLVYFNPGDLEFPIGLNLLANVAPDDRHLVASGIVSALKGIWRDSWGPRLEYILYNAVSALLDCQDAALLGVNRILTDDDFRGFVVKQVRRPTTGTTRGSCIWIRFPKSSKRSRKKSPPPKV